MKKDAILRAATRLFAERGFANTPTILLAREAGVAEGTIFRHFKSKEEIFCTLIEQVRKQLRTDIVAYVQSRSPKSGMETALSIAGGFCAFVRKNRLEFGLVFRDASSRYGDDSDPAFRAIRSMYEDVGYLFYEAILQGQADGTVGAAVHPQDTAALLVCMLMGFMRGVHFNVIRQTEVQNDMIPHLLTNITLMLSPTASAAPGGGPDAAGAVSRAGAADRSDAGDPGGPEGAPAAASDASPGDGAESVRKIWDALKKKLDAFASSG